MRQRFQRLGVFMVVGLVAAGSVLALWFNESKPTDLSQTANPSAPASPLAATLSSPANCPLPYSGFCEFVTFLDDLIVAGDIDQILAVTQQGVCPAHDEMVDYGCRSGEPYIRIGILQGEGLLLSINGAAMTWAERAEPPRHIRGLCDTPDVWACSKGPAILVRTSDPVWDWIFSAQSESGEWRIASITLQRREYEDRQIPPEVIVAWP